MTASEQLNARIAETRTALLVTSLIALDAQDSTPERNLVRARMIEELERRFPQADAAVQAAFTADEVLLEQGVDTPGVDYVAVLVAAIPATERI